MAMCLRNRTHVHVLSHAHAHANSSAFFSRHVTSYNIESRPSDVPSYGYGWLSIMALLPDKLGLDLRCASPHRFTCFLTRGPTRYFVGPRRSRTSRRETVDARGSVISFLAVGTWENIIDGTTAVPRRQRKATPVDESYHTESDPQLSDAGPTVYGGTQRRTKYFLIDGYPFGWAQDVPI